MTVTYTASQKRKKKKKNEQKICRQPLQLALIYSSHRMVRILLCYTALSLKLEDNTFAQTQPIVEVQVNLMKQLCCLFVC